MATELSALGRLNETAWRRLPSVVTPRLAPLAADGLHLSAWPVVGALALPVAAAAGLLLGMLHLGYDQPGRFLYLYSFGTMILLVAISQNGAACGVALWLGFVLGDFLHELAAPDNPENLVMLVPARLLAAAVLATPLIGVPVSAHALTQSVLARAPKAGTGDRGPLLRAVGLQALAAAGLVFMWLQVAPVLLQPVYLWQGLGPLTHGLEHAMQTSGWIIALVAGYAASLRAVVELAAERPALAARRAAVRRAQAARPLGGLRERAIAAGVTAALLTFTSSQLLASWAQALELFVFTAAVVGLSRPVLARIDPGRWLLPALPMAGRFLLGVGLMTVVGAALAASSLGRSGFGAALISIEIGLVVFAMLMTPARESRPVGAG